MTTTTRPENLRAAWRDLETRRRVRTRDAAELLGVSEAELIASACGEGVTRLAGDARAVLARVPEIGRAMALTRNPACVHEKTGVYENLSTDAMIGLALGRDIDLRLFYRHWVHAFAVENNGLASLQFFDAAGDAVHKIFLKDGADRGASGWIKRTSIGTEPASAWRAEAQDRAAANTVACSTRTSASIATDRGTARRLLADAAIRDG